jgi:hypothetical protein
MSEALVKKIGSRWEGCVTLVEASGSARTNVRAAEVAVFSSAKVWVRLKEKKMPYKTGASGFIEISAPPGVANVGDMVVVEFHS